MRMPTSGSGRAGDLREHLSATLRAAQSVTSKLGGGGMSRVFGAENTALDEGMHNGLALPAGWNLAPLRAHPRFRQPLAPTG